MGFFQTVAIGYRRMYHETIFAVKNHSHQILSGTGTGLMMIGSGLFARTAAKEEVRQAIAETERVLAEVKAESKTVISAEQPKEVVKERKKKYRNAYLKHIGTIVKMYRKPIIVEAIGAGLNIAGMVDADTKLDKAVATTAAVSGTFLAYRRNVIAEQGEEADRRYLTGEALFKVKEVNKDEETGEEVVQDYSDKLILDKDPNAFRFLFSRENCPSVWVDNYDLRLAKLDHITDELNIIMRSNGHITLNDMRRAFGGLTPRKMDVGIGGIMGRIWDPGNPQNPDGGKLIDLGYSQDKDFMEGRKDWCWIIFPVDPQPIIGKIDKIRKLTEVEQ